MKRRPSAFVVHTEGRGNGLRHPVESDIGQQLISGKAAVEIASTIGPRQPVSMGHCIDGWRVCWLGGWDKQRLFFVVMLVRAKE
jgi:hypothetical protein